MAQVNGFYSDGYVLSDYNNTGIYYKAGLIRSKWYDPRIDSIDNGMKLISGKTYEIMINANDVPSAVKLQIKCNVAEKIVVEIEEDGVITDSETNSSADIWEEITLTPTKSRVKIRIKILPIAIGKVAVGYFKDVRVFMNNCFYSLDSNFDEFMLDNFSNNNNSNYLWVKINGEWKPAKITII
jgi:hypothetical protein